MLDQELCTTSLEVRIASEPRRALDKAVVGGGRVRMGSSAGVVQGSEDSWRATLFNKVAHDLVVEVLDRRPLDLLPNVLLLFGLERELNEDLLQFLVDVIDAQLLE